MQLLIVILIIVMAIAYAARRIYTTVTNDHNNPCACCQGCNAKEKNIKKKDCKEKKQ